MPLWLKVYTALTEDPGLVPITHMVTHNHYNFCSKGSETSFWLPQAPGMHVRPYMYTNIYTH